MAETVLGLRVEVRITGTVVGADGARLVVDLAYDKTFDEGTGTDQLGQVWKDDARALNTTSEDLDMVGTAPTAFQGEAMALNNLKIIYIKNLDTDAGDYLLLKQGSAAPVTTILGGTTPTIKIGPGGLLLWVDPQGSAVTSTTADKLAMEAVDNSTFDILLGGDNA